MFDPFNIDLIGASEVNRRIKLRLRRQHLHWWMRNPESQSFWNQLRLRWHHWSRKVDRRWRPLLSMKVFQYAGLVVAAGLLLACIWLAGICLHSVATSIGRALFLQPPVEISEALANHALACWSMFASISVLVLWCFSPGAHRTIDIERFPRKPNRPPSFIRHADLRLIRFPIGKIWLTVSTLFCLVLLGIGSPKDLAIFGVVCAAAMFWMSWQIGMRLRTHKARTYSGSTIWQYLGSGFGILALLSLTVLKSPRLSGLASSMGPFGWTLSGIENGTAPVLWFVLTTIGYVLIGYLAKPHVHSWNYRRRLVVAHSLQLPGPPDTATISGETADHSDRIAQLVRESQRHCEDAPLRQPWSSWLLPREFHQIPKFTIFALVLLVSYQLIMYGLLQLHLQPGSIEIMHKGVPKHEIIRSLLCLPVSFVLSVTEALALAALFRNRVLSFEQRPLSALGFFVTIHRHGLGRSLFQFGLAVAFAILAVSLGASLAQIVSVFVAGVVTLLLIRTLYVINCVVRAWRPFSGTVAGILLDVLPVLSGVAMLMLCAVVPVSLVR